MRARRALQMAVAVSLWPGVAHAEVMDKMPDPLELWLACGAIVILALALSRWRARAALLTLPAGALYIYLVASEVFDPIIYPAILNEAGWSYLIQPIAAAALSVVAPIVVALRTAGRRVRPGKAGR